MEEAAAASSGSQGSPAGASAEKDDTDESRAAALLHFRLPREPEMLLPIANVGRLMRRALPANAKIAREAKHCVQDCVAEFVGFVTSEASDGCLKDKRKTITGDDVISAMTILGFDNYAEVLKAYLNRYREFEGDNKSASGTKSVNDPGKDNDGGFSNLPNVLP